MAAFVRVVRAHAGPHLVPAMRVAACGCAAPAGAEGMRRAGAGGLTRVANVCHGKETRTRNNVQEVQVQ